MNSGSLAIVKILYLWTAAAESSRVIAMADEDVPMSV